MSSDKLPHPPLPTLSEDCCSTDSLEGEGGHTLLMLPVRRLTGGAAGEEAEVEVEVERGGAPTGDRSATAVVQPAGCAASSSKARLADCGEGGNKSVHPTTPAPPAGPAAPTAAATYGLEQPAPPGAARAAALTFLLPDDFGLPADLEWGLDFHQAVPLQLDDGPLESGEYQSLSGGSEAAQYNLQADQQHLDRPPPTPRGGSSLAAPRKPLAASGPPLGAAGDGQQQQQQQQVVRSTSRPLLPTSSLRRSSTSILDQLRGAP